MSKFRDQLVNIAACSEALEWVANRQPAVAWSGCERSDWMIWLLRRCNTGGQYDKELRLLAADFAEDAWGFCSEDGRLAAAWAIDVARRFAAGEADEEERAAAADAAAAAAADAADADAAAAAAYADAAAAAYAAAAAAAYAAAAAAAAAAYNAARSERRAYQCDVIRARFPTCPKIDALPKEGK